MGRIVRETEGNRHGLYQGRYCSHYINRTLAVDCSPCSVSGQTNAKLTPIQHHHHKHQGFDPLIRSVSRVTAARANASSVFQLYSFLVVCSGMIPNGFGFVAFFASVKASSVCIHLYCLVRLQSAVRVVCSHLCCGHKGCSLPEVSVT